MSDKRSIIAFEHYREGEQRFEYFITGVSTALCAYVGQTLQPHQFGYNAYTLEVISLALIVGSIILSFKRLELGVTIHSLNHSRLHMGEVRDSLCDGIAAMSDEAHKKMSVYDRDNKISDIASMAAEAFAEKYDPARNERDIKSRPEHYLAYTIPYLTVRALHRQETALASLKADSKWIKAFAIITGILTLVLVGLTIVLMIYASRLDTVIHSLRSIASPTSTVTPTLTPHGSTNRLCLNAVKPRDEERMMLEEFGDEYATYMAKTKRLVPGIWGTEAPAGLGTVLQGLIPTVEPSSLRTHTATTGRGLSFIAKKSGLRFLSLKDLPEKL